MARMPVCTRYGVFELGMNHAGEISDLSKLLKPDIAVITNVGEAHLAQFNNVLEIADAKSEIIDGLGADGILILNNDNEYSSRILDKAKDKRVITFGYSETSDVLIVANQCEVNGSNIRLKINNQLIDLYIAVPGKHWVTNIATCMAVAYASGLDLRKASIALSAITAQPGRGEQSLIDISGKKITLIDESYNANVVSMKASIELLGLKSGRLIAILGDMNELGEDELNLHLSLSEPIKEASIDLVILIGKNMQELKSVIPQRIHSATVKNWEQAITELKKVVEDGDNVLVKGSNSLGLEKLVEALKVGNI
jgi:UDP-N-acetylmuramoyl-tripeptide--D-alanyl-D-alanine ligase